MILNEAREILTAPRPAYTKQEDGENILYLFQSSTGPMLVEFLPREISHYNKSDLAYKIPPEYITNITSDDKGDIHYYELRFGQQDPEYKNDVRGYEKTNTGNPTEIFIGVLGAVEQFLREYSEFSFLYYSAAGRGRVKSYNLLTKLMTEIQKVPFFIKNGESDHAIYFVFLKDTAHTNPWDYEISEEDEEEEEAKKTYYLNSWFNVEDEDEYLRIDLSYALLSQEDDEDSWEEEEGPYNDTSSEVFIYRVGQGKPLTEDTEFLHFLEGFNALNGIGVYVVYPGEITPEQAYDNAVDRWAGGSYGANMNYDIDTYKLDKELRFMFKDVSKIDFIIVKDKSLDDLVKEWLSEYFDFRSPAYYSLESPRFSVLDDIEDNEGNPYWIYVRTDYDYEKSEQNVDDWVSLPSQRRRDRQQDLPFGL